MKETDVIKLIKKAFPLTGDDSYWEKDGIAMSVDSSIQGRHFLLERDNWIEEGVWNSVAGAITDVAAVGSNPKLIMASFCFPSKTNESIIKNFNLGYSGNLRSNQHLVSTLLKEGFSINDFIEVGLVKKNDNKDLVFFFLY